MVAGLHGEKLREKPSSINDEDPRPPIFTDGRTILDNLQSRDLIVLSKCQALTDAGGGRGQNFHLENSIERETFFTKECWTSHERDLRNV